MNFAAFLQNHEGLLADLDAGAKLQARPVALMIADGWKLLDAPQLPYHERRQIRRALDFWTAYHRAQSLPDVTKMLARGSEAHQGARRHVLNCVVNGRSVSAEIDDRTLLADFLRDILGLTGTHIGCDTSQCGACVVHLGGHAVKSCTVLALQVEGQEVMTIEGLANPDGALHPLQAAFQRSHAIQCGFCTPGMIMTALDFLSDNPDPTDNEVREALAGNICRCTGYTNIIEAIQMAATWMRSNLAGDGVRFAL